MCIDYEYPYAVIDKFKMKLVFSFHFNLMYIMRTKMFNLILFLRNTICLNDNRIKTLFVVVNLLYLLARAVLWRKITI